MKSFAEIDIENNGDYLKLLSAVSKLSGLFSESAVPFLTIGLLKIYFVEVLKQKIYLVLTLHLMQISIL